MEEMELFVERVWKMRTAQKRYFSTRHQDYLRDAKRLEQQVDGMCLTFLKRLKKEPKQLDLGL